MLNCLYTAAQIRQRVSELGNVITQEMKDQDLLVVAVMNGGMFFAADLVRAMNMPVKLDSISVHSYCHHESTGELSFRGKLKLNPAGRHVMIVDDILDTGFTMCRLKKYFKEQGADSVHICCLIDKDLPMENKLCHADWFAFRSPNAYLVGYGLDSDELYRNLPDIYELNND